MTYEHINRHILFKQTFVVQALRFAFYVFNFIILSTLQDLYF